MLWMLLIIFGWTIPFLAAYGLAYFVMWVIGWGSLIADFLLVPAAAAGFWIGTKAADWLFRTGGFDL